MGFRLQNTDYKLHITDTDTRLHNTCHIVEVTHYRIYNTGYRIQVTEYRLQNTGYRIQVT
jgi:hypothetical protein